MIRCPRCNTRTYPDIEDKEYRWCPNHGTVHVRPDRIIREPGRPFYEETVGFKVRPIITGVEDIYKKQKLA